MILDTPPGGGYDRSGAAGRQALLEVFEAGMKGYEKGAAAYRQSVEGGDAKAVAVIKDAAGEGLKGFLGLDPATFRITRAGLEITGGR